ncbi:MAG: hypothetical protein AAAFM81_03145 [Pseudomonadota bacterium]
MKQAWSIGINLTALLATLMAMGIVLAMWSVGYTPRWPEQNGTYRGSFPVAPSVDNNPWPNPVILRERRPSKQFAFRDIAADGDLRLVIAPSFGDAVSITVENRPNGLWVTTKEFSSESGDPPVKRQFRRRISSTDYDELVRKIYALGIYDQRHPEFGLGNDGIGVVFMTIVDGRYYWSAGKLSGQQYSALVRLFRSVCGVSCNDPTLGAISAIHKR